MVEQAEPLSKEHARDFFRVVVGFHTKTVALARIREEHGPARTMDAVKMAPADEVVDRLLELGGWLDCDEFSGFLSGGVTDVLRTALLSTDIVDFFLNEVVRASGNHRFTDTKMDTVAWMIVQLCSDADAAGELRDYDSVFEFLDVYEGSSCRRRRELLPELVVALRGEAVAAAVVVDGEEVYPGGRHDNDRENFRDVSIMPTKDEVVCPDPPYLPPTYAAIITAAMEGDGEGGGGGEADGGAGVGAEPAAPAIGDVLAGRLTAAQRNRALLARRRVREADNERQLQDSVKRANATNGVLDYNFRMLRHDMIGPFNAQLRAYMKTRRRGRDTFFRIFEHATPFSVFLEPARAQDRDREVCIVFTFDIQGIYGARQNAQFWQKTKALAHGSVVALLDDDGSDPIFAEIVRRNPDELLRRGHWDERAHEDYKRWRADYERRKEVGQVEENERFETPGRGYSMIGLRFTPDDAASIIDDMYTMYQTRSYTMVEALPSFFAFKPILKKLQDLKRIPFFEELFMREDAGPPPYYNAGRRQMVLQRDADINAGYEGLDDSQKYAFDHVLSHRVGLIQGPPGTGKTHVGALVVRAILSMLNQPGVNDDERASILCVCYTNHALDQFLEHLLDAGIDGIVRIGHTNEERIEPLLAWKIRERSSAARRDIAIVHSKLKEAETTAKSLRKKLDNFEFKDWDDVEEFLKVTYPSEHTQLRLPESTDGYSTVGKKGKGLGRTDLWKYWKQGYTRAALPGEIGKHTALAGELWSMTRAQRKNRLLEWTREALAQIPDQLAAVMHVIASLKERKKELQAEDKRAALQRASVIGCTTTGAAKHSALLQAANARVVIVEEAGEVLDAHIITSLGNAEHLILIGDHRQLRPKVNNYELAQECKRTDHQLNVSLFEQLATAEDSGVEVARLARQHRMRPEISSTIRGLHYEWLEDAEGTHGRDHIVGLQDDVVFINHDELEDNGKNEPTGSTTKVNSYEARVVVDTVEFLIQQGYSPADIVVLTPYVGQMLHIRRELAKKVSVFLDEMDIAAALAEGEDVDVGDDPAFQLSEAELAADGDGGDGGTGGGGGATGAGGRPKNKGKAPAAGEDDSDSEQRPATISRSKDKGGPTDKDEPRAHKKGAVGGRIGAKQGGGAGAADGSVRVATVDNYQGNEAKIIVASLVRANTWNGIGFLGEAPRVNVLLSRARDGLIVIGNFNKLTSAKNADHRAYWQKVMRLNAGHVYSGLPTRCVVHGREKVLVTHEDFAQYAANGGCNEPCGVDIGCGHLCDKLCHTTDRDHVYARAHCKVTVPAAMCPAGHERVRPCSVPALDQTTCNVCADITAAELKHEKKLASIEAKTKAKLAELAKLEQEEREKGELAAAELDASIKVREVELRIALEKMERERTESIARVTADKEGQDLAAAVEEERRAAQLELEGMKGELAAHNAAVRRAAEQRRQAMQHRVRVQREQIERAKERLEQRTREKEAAARERAERAEAAALKAQADVEARHAAFAEELREKERAVIAEQTRIRDEARIEHQRLERLHAAEIRGMDGRAEEIAGQMRTCCVCLMDDSILDGIMCDTDDRHFTCDQCFNVYVQSVANEPTVDITAPGPLVCQAQGCGVVLKLEHIGDHGPIALRTNIMNILVHFREAVVVAQVEADANARVQAEIDKLHAMDELERAAFDAVKHIREDIINLKCPRCDAVFTDYTACSALTCRCGAKFCAFCLQIPTRQEIHAHVASCDMNPYKQLHVSQDKFNAAHRKRREQEVAVFLRTLDRNVAARVVLECRVDFADLGLPDFGSYLQATSGPAAPARRT